MNQTEIIQKVKEHLEKNGYEVYASSNGHGKGPDIFAMKGDETFLIEAVGETRSRRRSSQDILISIGEVVKRMEKEPTKIRYGIAMPESFTRFLKDFEFGGFQALKLHLFIINEWGSVYHLDSQKTIEFLGKLRAGEEVYLPLMDVDYR